MFERIRMARTLLVALALCSTLVAAVAATAVTSTHGATMVAEHDNDGISVWDL